MKEKNRKRIVHILIHLIVWLGLFTVPFVIFYDNGSVHWRFAWRVLLMLFSIMITFYGNLAWAIDHYLYKKKYLGFALFNVALFFFVLEFRTLLSPACPSPLQHTEKHRVANYRNIWIFNDVVFYLLGVGASMGVRQTSRIQELEMERKKVENATLASELSLLKYQIQPHFFFNTLNNIYALIGKSPSEAQKSVLNLSKLMRYVLYDSEDRNMSIRQEIEFLRNYISLMCIRLNKDAVVAFDVPDNIVDAEVPSLVLVPIVENAFKHGVGRDGEADIHCSIKEQDGQIVFVVRNKVYDCANENTGHSGIGLDNLRKRMEILYGDSFVLDAGLDCQSRVYEAKMVIPIKAV